VKYYKNGRFGGKYDSIAALSLLDILKWKLFSGTLFASKREEPYTLEVKDETERLHMKEDFICWLGHASFLIQLGGKRLLVDPVLGNIPFYKRHTPSPYSADMLGRIDHLLLTHTHYDHFDTASLKQLLPRSSHACIPLKMGKLLRKIDTTVPYTELDWYRTYTDEGMKITFVPAKHWGRRGVFDKNRVLWGGFVIAYGGTTLYIAGDSAPGDHFEAIGEAFDIDMALLPIGAYSPRVIMKHNHMTPQEAYDAFKALRAKVMVPMHYGTFKLSDEPMDEPLAWMKEIVEGTPHRIEFLIPGKIWMI